MGAKKQGDKRWVRMSDTVASAVAAASFWAWLNLFHEMGRNQLMAVYYMDSASFTFNPGGFHCAALPFGLFLGAALYFAAARFGRGALFERVPAMGYFVGLLVLQFLHYAASFLLHAYGLMIIIYVVINAVCAIVLIRIIICSSTRETKEVAVVVVACALAYAAADAVLVVLPPNIISPEIGEIAHASFLIIAYGALRYLPTGALKYSEGDGRGRAQTLKKIPQSVLFLVMHLVLFGAVLGSLHAVGSGFVYGSAGGTPASVAIANLRNIPLVVSSVIAACIIWHEFSRGPLKPGEIWDVIRKWIAPFSIGGFLLLPLVSLSGLAAVLMDCGAVLYQLLFVFACGRVIRESDYSAVLITAGGLMFLSLGWTVGDFISVVPLSGISRDPLQLSIMTFVVFILCVIATFWVGSVYDVKRLWGLRRSHLPKEFHDIVLQRKCELLIKQHLLTRREGEVLSLLAAGKRPACIGKELHISSNTVRTHIQNTYVKMGVHSVEGINEALEATYVEASGVSCEVQPTES